MIRILALITMALQMASMLPLAAHRHHADVIVVEQPVVVAPVVVAPVAVAPGPSVVLIESEPPTEVIETPTACPGSSYYWQKGCWKWDNGWRWNSGCWVVRPSSQAVWAPGYWVKHHHRHGWYWVEGYWK